MFVLVEPATWAGVRRKLEEREAYVLTLIHLCTAVNIEETETTQKPKSKGSVAKSQRTGRLAASRRLITEIR